MAKSEKTGAQKYFDKVPKQWDTIYSHENWFMNIINQCFRKALYDRYRLTFENCGDLKCKKVLDIGCGTGRYSIECATRGASRVVGIDFAPSMVEFSKDIAQQMGVSDKCEFICSDVLTYPFEDSFDVVLALGFFDYIKEPEHIFRRISELNPKRFVASFPRYFPIWDIQRKIRYHWIRKCPIYNYTKEELEKLASEAPFSQYEIIPCRRGYILVAGTG